MQIQDIHPRLRKGLSRRGLLLAVPGLTLAATLLQACQPSPPSGAAATQAPSSGQAAGSAAATPQAGAAGGAAGTPTRGGTLTVAVQNDWDTLDPLYAGADLNGAFLLYGDWIGWKKDPQSGQWGPVPEMVSEWDVGSDHLTLTLQQGISFQDSTPWDATSAKWNLDRMIFDPASLMKSYFGGVDTSQEDSAALANLKATAAQTFDYTSKAVEIVSPNVVRVHLQKPNAALLTSLSGVLEWNPPVSPTAYKRLGKNAFGRNPVGAGPFKLVEWVSGSHITMDRNPDYWKLGADGQKLPYVDRIQVELIVDDSTRLVELKSGNAQFTFGIQGKDLAGVQADPNLAVLESSSSGNAYRMIFDSTNSANPFQRHKELRQAMLYAMDRDAMLQTLGFGHGYATRYLLPQGSFAYDESNPYYAYDKAKADQLVKQTLAGDPSIAGSDGKIPVTLTVINRATDKAQAEMIKQMAESVGFNVNIELLERSAWTAKLVKSPGQQGGVFQFATMQNGPTVDDPDAQWRRYYHSQGSFNVAHIDDPAWDSLLDKGISTYDIDQRKAVYRQLEQMAYDQAWYGYLWMLNYNWDFSRKLKGFEEAVATHYILSDVWLQ